MKRQGWNWGCGNNRFRQHYFINLLTIVTATATITINTHQIILLVLLSVFLFYLNFIYYCSVLLFYMIALYYYFISLFYIIILYYHLECNRFLLLFIFRNISIETIFLTLLHWKLLSHNLHTILSYSVHLSFR